MLHGIAAYRWFFACCALLVIAAMGVPPARAQAPSPALTPSLPSWAFVADGRPVAWPLPRAYPLDSLDRAAEKVLESVRRDGYYFATLDSVIVSRATEPPTVRIHVSRGDVVPVGTLRLTGVEAFDEATLRARMETRPGRPLDAAALEADLDALLAQYDAAGLPLAQIYLDTLALEPGPAPSLRLVLRVEEGQTLRLSRVDVEGGERTRPAYLARVAGLRLGQPLAVYNLAALQQRFEATGFFKTVDRPELLLDPATGEAVLRVQVEEEPPGAFDLVLGLQPATGASSRLQFVGNGHLALNNLFGGGRTASFRLNRLPGQVSRLEAGIADPYLAGWPLRVAAHFEGIQQDSTFGQQRYRLEAGYQFAGGVQVFGTLSRELTRPGQAGVRLGRTGQQRIPRAGSWFGGLGIRFARLDRAINPRKGFVVETNLEQGRKERSARERIDGDTTLVRTVLRQERLRASGRLFVPTFVRQAVVLGGDAHLLLSNEYDRSDLFRFGGATSLRGYDEEQFLGRLVSRALVEYRLQLDRQSYTYLFADLGYIERPALVGEDDDLTLEATKDVLPGYGFGLQVGTEVGLINASYAISPDDGPAAGRVHIGLSFGL